MKLFLLLALAYPDASATSYFMSATGNDGNNGLSAGVPWLSPNHALNCGDTITAAASTAYSATNFGSAKWGTVTCAGNNNVAWVQCAAFDGCKITVSANFGMFVSKSYWGVQGFEVAETGNGGLCFGVIPAGGSTIHHIILANNICNGGANGFASSPQNTTAGVDYLVLLGNIAWNAAQSTTLCNSGITNYEPIKSDSLSGTHNYIAGNFLFDNSSPTNCLGGSATFDGNGIALDDLGNAQQSGTPYDQLTVVENNISVWNGGYGLGVTGNGNPSAPVIFRNNTSVHNWTSVNSSATTCGDVGFLASSFTTAYGNLIQTAGATGCSGPTALYGFAVNGANGTDSVYGNFIYSASGSNTTSVSSPGFSYGTNLTGANPLLANPVDPGQPNCTGKTSTVDCMSAVIANFRPALAAAQPYGYQQPGVSPVANGLYPQWLCNVTLPAGIVTPGCLSISYSGSPPGAPSGAVQIKPQAVPTSSTAVTGYDAYLKMITVTNTTAGALTFTLADGQAAPVAVLQAVPIAANTTYVISFPSLYWCPGGFTVAASGAGLRFYATWTQ